MQHQMQYQMQHQILDEKKQKKKEIVKYEKIILFYENLITKMDAEHRVLKNIPLSQLDNKIIIIKQLMDVKKDLNKKNKGLEYMNKILEYISKAKTIKPEEIKKEQEIKKEEKIPINKKVEIVEPIKMIEPVKTKIEFQFELKINNEIKDIYNCLNILQSQIDFIMNKLNNINIEIKN
jgi:hypothetical protein